MLPVHRRVRGRGGMKMDSRNYKGKWFRVGEEGQGFRYQMLQFQEERLSAISNLRPLERAIEQTIEHCGQRQAFGKSILDNQTVYFRLAELQTEMRVTYRWETGVEVR